MEASDAADLRRFLVLGWIDDQIAFSAARHYRRRTQYTRAVYALATITIIVAALHLAQVGPSEDWHNWFTFLAITLPGFGGALTGLREHGLHQLHEERSRRTAERLQQLRRRLPPDPDLEAVFGLAAEAHKIVTEESLEWSGVIQLDDLEVVI